MTALSSQEVTQLLQVSHVTVARDWDFAKAWLNKELAPGKSDES